MIEHAQPHIIGNKKVDFFNQPRAPSQPASHHSQNMSISHEYKLLLAASLTDLVCDMAHRQIMAQPVSWFTRWS